MAVMEANIYDDQLAPVTDKAALRRRGGVVRPLDQTIYAEYQARGIKGAWTLFCARRKFSGSVRDSSLDQLARLLENEMSLTVAADNQWRLATNDGRKPNTALGTVYTDWAMKIANGQKMNEALADWISPFGRPILQAGESSGSISKAIDNYLYISNIIGQIRSALIGGLFYPISLILMNIAYLYVVAYVVDPAFNDAVPKEQWTGTLYLLGVLASLVKGYFIIVSIAAVLFGAWVTWSLPKWTRASYFIGRFRLTFDFLAPWSIYRMIYGANFMLSYSALYSAGVKDPDIIRIMMRQANPWYYERLAGALRWVDNGQSMGEALHRSGFLFPDPQIVGALRSYSRAGTNMSGILDRVSRTWVERNLKNIRGAIATIGVLAMVVSTMVVILIVLADFAFVSLASKIAG